ncbi:metalloregulator ArsR/SmtB family transcription factor [Myroides odoratus]|uniref:ArsR/SmtB family transcription factor n=1 Tax=Myroides odoratus TaxID=256 RepID=UPI003340F2C7
MDKRVFKDTVYTELAKVAKAMANPVRLEIIDLLAQGPFSVELIAKYTNQSIANTSQHLQNLKKAQLVQINKQGNFVYYSLRSNGVYKTWIALRELGIHFNAEVEKVIADFRQGQNENLQAIDADTLTTLLQEEEILLLDVRPEEEYNRGHIHQALSMPLQQLEEAVKTLEKRKTIVAYCRGPFCVYADQAVAFLMEKGFKAVRLEEGYPEWALKGLPTNKKEE